MNGWRGWAVVGGIVAGSLSAMWWWSAVPERPGRALPPFRMEGLTDRGRQWVDRDRLLGQVWVADFIFTSCEGPCPLITSKMAELQTKLPPSVRLVTFTVDPDRDTLPMLKAYAERWQADRTRWWFVRGEKSALAALMREGFQLPLAEDSDAPSGFRVTHSAKLVLVDGQGAIRGYFDADSEEALISLDREARRLSKASAP